MQQVVDGDRIPIFFNILNRMAASNYNYDPELTFEIPRIMRNSSQPAYSEVDAFFNRFKHSELIPQFIAYFRSSHHKDALLIADRLQYDLERMRAGKPILANSLRRNAKKNWFSTQTKTIKARAHRTRRQRHRRRV